MEVQFQYCQLQGNHTRLVMEKYFIRRQDLRDKKRGSIPAQQYGGIVQLRPNNSSMLSKIGENTLAFPHFYAHGRVIVAQGGTAFHGERRPNVYPASRRPVCTVTDLGGSQSLSDFLIRRRRKRFRVIKNRHEQMLVQAGFSLILVK